MTFHGVDAAAGKADDKAYPVPQLDAERRRQATPEEYAGGVVLAEVVPLNWQYLADSSVCIRVDGFAGKRHGRLATACEPAKQETLIDYLDLRVLLVAETVIPHAGRPLRLVNALEQLGHEVLLTPAPKARRWRDCA